MQYLNKKILKLRNYLVKLSKIDQKQDYFQSAFRAMTKLTSVDLRSPSQTGVRKVLDFNPKSLNFPAFNLGLNHNARFFQI